MKTIKRFFYVLALSSSAILSHSQCAGWTGLQTLDSLFTNPALGNSTSPEIDRLNRPYTYLAMVNGGVKIYDNNSSGNPILAATVSKSSLGNLDAINLFQDSIWLYVSLGNIWNSSSQMAGLAIIDVSNPSTPNVLDVYVHNGLGGGSGAVITRGNYAFLAANQNGLVILDISNKNNIQFTSSLGFSNNFPHSTTGSSSMYNARGIGLMGNQAYVCYDRGGLRIVDISNINAPVQISQYCYPTLINKITAYNNIAIHHNVAFVAIDYYGMEILDISNPNNVTQIGWWHPESWADTSNAFNTWANSKGHANEIAYDSICRKVYLAAGKSDVLAIDVSTLSNPVTCETHGSAADAYGTWGLDFYKGRIGIAYIWSVAFPPYSNYTGFKLLQTNCSATGFTESNARSVAVKLYPNPVTDAVHVSVADQKIRSVRIFTPTGETILEYFSEDIPTEDLPPGLYFAIMETDRSTFTCKFIKN